MKTLPLLHALILVTLLMDRSLLAAPLGTAFTFQGRLADNGSAVNGVYELRLTLHTNGTSMTVFGPPLTNSAVMVADGLFTTTLDFGLGVFDGTLYWLQIGVRTNGAISPFVSLTPRQSLMPAPSAQYALIAGFANSLASNTVVAAHIQSGAITAAKLADGSVLTEILDDDGSGSGLDADLFDGLNSTAFWKLGGNNNAPPGANFLGTADNQPLDLRVNNARVLRLEPAGESPNLIGGHAGNTAAGAMGAVIAGGGHLSGIHRVLGSFGTVGGGLGNEAGDGAGGFGEKRYATVGGGFLNRASGDSATVSGGRYNTGSGPVSVIGGGTNNLASAFAATVAGGHHNTGARAFSTVGGGQENTATNVYATVAGGFFNLASGDSAGVAGGSFNVAAAESSSIGGGFQNMIETNASRSTVGGGILNTVKSDAVESCIGGGYGNTIENHARNSVIAGGELNTIKPNARHAIIAGGLRNSAAGAFSFAAGRRAQANHAGAFVWADSVDADLVSTNANQLTIRASGGTRVFSDMGASVGVILSAGGVAWSSLSDRQAKKNFQAVDGEEILNKISRLPIERWNYQHEASGDVPHMGPMAQDFKGMFYPGRDDKTISTLEFDGVTLAAVKTLEKRTTDLKQENQELRVRLAALEKLCAALAQKSDARGAR